MKYLTPRMVFGVVAVAVLTALTLLYPKWLIVPAVVAVLFVMFYGLLTIVQAVIDNEWPW